MTSCVAADGCITCGDVATAMRVLEIDHARELALCSSPDGAHSSVEIALVAGISRGDLVLVHAGTALTRLSDAEGAP